MRPAEEASTEPLQAPYKLCADAHATALALRPISGTLRKDTKIATHPPISSAHYC